MDSPDLETRDLARTEAGRGSLPEPASHTPIEPPVLAAGVRSGPWTNLTADPESIELLLQSTGDGIFDWDLTTNTVRFNARWKILLGYGEDELPDQPDLWRQLSHPDDLPGVDERLHNHLHEYWPFSHTWRMRHRCGDWRTIWCRAASARDAEGNVTRLVAVFSDFTAQAQNEERQRALIAALPDLLLRIRSDGLVLDCHDNAPPGQSASARSISTGSFLVTGTEDDAAWAPEALAAVRQAITEGVTVLREQVPADGGLCLELRAVKSGGDEAVCIVRDITERKVAEQRERELRAQVEALLVAEKDRLSQELLIAERLQTALLPNIRSLPSLEVCCRMWPASEVGGDYFDVVPCKDGGWLAIGDVSGHGLNAGIIMLMVQSGIATMIARNPDASPSEVLQSVNRMLHENIRSRLKGDDYVTINLVRYWSDGRIVYSGAHEEMFIFRAADGRQDAVSPVGAWLGVIEDLSPFLDDTPDQLEPGDLIVLYTDGITEAQDGKGEQFGPQRLRECVHAMRDRSLGEIRDHVFRTLAVWSDVRADDMSLVLARRRRGA